MGFFTGLGAEVVLEEVGYTSEKMAASMGSGEPVLGGRETNHGC